jgi:hypothetical protein
MKAGKEEGQLLKLRLKPSGFTKEQAVAQMRRNGSIPRPNPYLRKRGRTGGLISPGSVKRLTGGDTELEGGNGHTYSEGFKKRLKEQEE